MAKVIPLFKSDLINFKFLEDTGFVQIKDARGKKSVLSMEEAEEVLKKILSFKKTNSKVVKFTARSK